MKILEGNIITMALEGNFDCICHGCNCFNTQGSGVALQMNQTFQTGNPNLYNLESKDFRGDYKKLGKIEYTEYTYKNNNILNVINCYTQYYYGNNKNHRYLDYQALEKCMKEINNTFKGKVLGIPYLIGCGLAGGLESRVLEILERTLTDLEVILVKLK